MGGWVLGARCLWLRRLEGREKEKEGGVSGEEGEERRGETGDDV